MSNLVGRTIEDLAREAVKRPDSFAYFGDRDLFGSWGFTHVGGQHRDSDPLQVSNHVTILRDLSERFPEDIEDLHSSHCMVGWVDEIIVRVYDDSGAITPAFRAVYDWHERMSDYPVADENDYSERELDDLLETLVQCYDIPKDDASAFASWAEYCSSEELREDQIERDWQEYVGELESAAIGI